MEDDLPGDPFTIEEEGGGEVDYSLAVDGVIGVSGIDWFFQLGSGEGVFPDKLPIEAGNAGTTVNKGVGVDGFQGV